MSKYGEYAHILPSTLSSTVQEWLAEDVPSFDYAGFVVGQQQESAFLLAKAPGILAGVPFVDEVFSQLGCIVEWAVPEGSELKVDASNPKLFVARVSGPANKLLQGERVALNTLARCSGIATRSNAIKTKARRLGWKGIIAGTRKTTPGFRLVEKYGMIVGGIDPHRFDLSSMIMLKDNHIWSKGSITEAVRAARSVAGFSQKIDVECTSEAEAIEAVNAGADIIMLDNFSPSDLVTTSRRLKEDESIFNGSLTTPPSTSSSISDSLSYPQFATTGGAKFLIEVSGGITEENVDKHLCKYVDILSTSAVHQSVPHIDFSLKIQPKASTAKDMFA